MNIEPELRTKLDKNQHIVFITETDDLLAAWQYQRKSSSRRSKNMCMVPTEWRYSAPPPYDKSLLMPCHVTYQRKTGRSFSTIEPAPEYSTNSCHHGRNTISAPDMDALEAVTFAKRNMAPYVSPIIDTATLALVCKDLGLSGKAIPKVINGRQYIAFSGYPGARTLFPGTIYSVQNRKIVRLAIGALGIKNMVKSGGLITFFITVPLTILEAFLKDHPTCFQLVGGLAMDLLKIGIPALIGAVLGLAVGTVTTIASLPIVVVIGVSVSTNFALSLLDDKYQLTEKLIEALENLGREFVKKQEKMQNAFGRAYHDIERNAVLRTSGMDIDNLLP